MAVPPTRDRTLRPEWQCHPHCQMASSVPRRYVQGRVAVPPTWNCTLRAEWQCHPHCHSTSSARAARPYTATRRRAYRNGALRPEWQCHLHGTARSGPSGSATCTGPHAQGRVAVPSTLPNGIERTEAVRLGSSGSAIGTLRAEWQCISHCHSTMNVRWWNVQGRVAVRARATHP